MVYHKNICIGTLYIIPFGGFLVWHSCTSIEPRVFALQQCNRIIICTRAHTHTHTPHTVLEARRRKVLFELVSFDVGTATEL